MHKLKVGIQVKKNTCEIKQVDEDFFDKHNAA